MTLVNALSVLPRQTSMATSETLPMGFDTTPLLQELQAPVSASSVLTDLSDGDAVVELLDTPTILDNEITQIVRGSELTATHQYQLAVTFVVDAATVWTMFLVIVVPQ